MQNVLNQKPSCLLKGGLAFLLGERRIMVKRIALITLFLLLGILINSSFAVEVTVYGPEDFEKLAHGPTVRTETFTIAGLSGSGQLIITNHGKKWWQRVRLAKIWLNGELICRSRDFRGFPQSLLKNVNLQETNEIKVKLWGVQGKHLSIEVMKEFEAVAAAVVDYNGGEIVAPDGLSLIFPPDAVAEPTVITINEPLSPPPLPEDFVEVGPVIELGPDGTEFNLPILVSITLDHEVKIDQYETLGIAYYDHNTEKWELIPPFGYDRVNKRFMFFVHHFSDYQVVLMNTDDADKKVPFDILKDSLSAVNDVATLKSIDCWEEESTLHGICTGMAAFSKWYYDNKRSEEEGHFLRCIYGIDSAAKISCKAHNKLKNFFISTINTFATIYPNYINTVEIFSPVKKHLIKKLSKDNTPIQLDFVGTINGSIGGHSVLVVGWTNTTEGSGYFSVYDPNDNERLHRIDYYKTQYGERFSYSDHTFGNGTNLNNITPTIGASKIIDFDSYYNNETDYPKSSCDSTELITFKFTGHVIKENFYLDIQEGDPFEGYITYNTSAEDLNPQPEFGSYRGSSFSVKFTDNNIRINSPPNGFGIIVKNTETHDYLTFESTVNLYEIEDPDIPEEAGQRSMTMYLADTDGNTLNDIALPTSIYLGEWTYRSLRFHCPDWNLWCDEDQYRWGDDLGGIIDTFERVY